MGRKRRKHEEIPVVDVKEYERNHGYHVVQEPDRCPKCGQPFEIINVATLFSIYMCSNKVCDHRETRRF